MVVTLPIQRTAWLFHRRFVVVRNGDQVYLSWKQLTTLVIAAIAPAVVFTGTLWYWAERVVKVESRVEYSEKAIDAQAMRILAVESRDQTMARFEQHLVDIDRQLIEIKTLQKEAKP